MRVKVKKAIDGDTFQDSRKRFFRLAKVNTPEKGKPGFQKAKETFNEMAGDEELIAKVEGLSYGRPVVIVRKPGEKTTLNEKMRRKGYK